MTRTHSTTTAGLMLQHITSLPLHIMQKQPLYPSLFVTLTCQRHRRHGRSFPRAPQLRPRCRVRWTPDTGIPRPVPADADAARRPGRPRHLQRRCRRRRGAVAPAGSGWRRQRRKRGHRRRRSSSRRGRLLLLLADSGLLALLGAVGARVLGEAVAVLVGQTHAPHLIFFWRGGVESRRRPKKKGGRESDKKNEGGKSHRRRRIALSISLLGGAWFGCDPHQLFFYNIGRQTSGVSEYIAGEAARRSWRTPTSHHNSQKKNQQILPHTCTIRLQCRDTQQITRPFSALRSLLLCPSNTKFSKEVCFNAKHQQTPGGPAVATSPLACGASQLPYKHVNS